MFMLFDLHLHSRASIDALTKPETIVKVMKKKNWGFALTDHNHMDAYKGKNDIRKLAKKAGVFMIPAEEIRVDEDGEVLGEIIGYFLNEEIPITTFEEILDKIKEQDALLSCPHPFDWPRKRFKLFPTEWKKFDMMEVYNARAYYQGLNKEALEFSEGKNITTLGVSDAHTPEELGNGLTEIDAVNEEEFRKEIKKGRTKPIINKKAKIWHHIQTQFARKKWMKAR